VFPADAQIIVDLLEGDVSFSLHSVAKNTLELNVVPLQPFSLHKEGTDWQILGRKRRKA
jgi:hypothetical protein